MPKRNNEQRIKRNETRRKLKKLSRKAIFCLEHNRITRPDIFKEASELYEYLNTIYPHKHNLTKTAVYQRSIQNKSVKDQVLKHATKCRNTSQSGQVQPILNIPLMQIPSKPSTTIHDQATSTKETSQEQATVTDVERQQLPTIPPEEMDMLIGDLQQDPDLKYFFNDQFNIEVCGPEAKHKTLEEEINQIINEEFEAIGAELQDLINVDDELMC